jgi:hypothetical protein
LKADQIERVRLPEGLLMALQKAIATASAEPEVYLALELEKTYMMAGLRQGELYLLEASGLIEKQDFIAHARHIPLSRLSQRQRRAILMGYAAWATEQAADAGLKEPILA